MQITLAPKSGDKYMLVARELALKHPTHSNQLTQAIMRKVTK